MEHFHNNDEIFGENWFSYAEFYKDMVEKAPNDAVFVELGAWKGRSTCCMAVEIINSKKTIDFYTVDSWKYVPSTEQPVSSQDMFDEVYREFRKNIMPVKSFVEPIVSYSYMAAGLFSDASIDFVFIDASHQFEDVSRDIRKWFPKLKKGGIIAGHDFFTSVHPGVKRAVEGFFPEDSIKTIPEQNVWYVET